MRTDFETETGFTALSTETYWDLFATWANNEVDFSLTSSAYENFAQSCLLNGGNRVISSLQDVVVGGESSAYVHENLRMPATDVNGDVVEVSLEKYVVDVILGGDANTNEPLLLCNEPFPAPEFPNPCVEAAVNEAIYRGEQRYEDYIDSVKTAFREEYIAHCLGAEEEFEREFDEQEYQYTLYYYDQTGALQQTVPPEGVNKLANPGPSEAYRAAFAEQFVSGNAVTAATLVPNHGLETRYKYSSLGGMVEASTPDKGISKVWYDDLGRAVLAQDARQLSDNKYTYTEYDELSRPTEVGEAVSAVASSSLTDVFLASNDVDALLSNPTRQDITQTWYDESPFAIADFERKNLRNRVTATARASSPGTYEMLSHYSYDEHGNVHELWHEIPGLAAAFGEGQRYKRLRYDYDLISGNVNSLSYQTQEVDQWLHRYHYDANNRLKVAETSRDGLVWDRDEKAFYYLHGPKMRSELGHEKVQGTDYGHTIHGWIRGVNAGTLTPGRDMGRDGNLAGVNRFVARDAYAFELGFYRGDYSPIGGDDWQTTLDAGFASPHVKDLFNGNIAYQVIANKKLMEMNAGDGLNDQVLFKKYRYDQLNRLKSMDVVSGLAGNQWGTGGAAWNAYKVRLDFDRNGNILSLDRWDRTQQMDELSYAYNYNGSGMLIDNMLDHVTDPKGVIGNDIGSQSSGNYDYDEIGNLISDAGEEVDEILWDHYGKVSRVGRLPSSTKAELVFGYDAGGNRFRKKVEPASGDAETQYYVRDPQGNVLAIYRRHTVSAEEVLDLNELHIYGSERLGILADVERVATGAASSGGSGSGQRAVSPEGNKNVIVSGVLASEVADLVVLRNVSAERIDLAGLALRSGEQFFELDALELDAGERAVIAFGDGSDEASVMEALGRAVDTAEVWVWQDFVELGSAGGSLQVLLEGEVLESLDYAAGANERVAYSLRSAIADPSDLVSGDAFGQAARRGFLAGAGFMGAGRVRVERGRKMYELRDHLGNVAVVLRDRAVGVDDDVDGFADWFEGNVRSARDFYPFGMVMSGREYSVPDYRYGFQGQESDGEWLGVGNAVSYKYRVADARLGRFFSVDPLAPDYPWYAPYQFAGNKVVAFRELEGLEEDPAYYADVNDPFFLPRLFKTTAYEIKHSFQNLFLDYYDAPEGYKYQARYKKDKYGDETFETEVVLVERGSWLEERFGTALDALNVIYAGSIDATDLLAARTGTRGQVNRAVRDGLAEASTQVKKGTSKYKPDQVLGRKVFQNTEDFSLGKPEFVDKSVNKFIRERVNNGETNLDLMSSGNAPIGIDGKQVNLHHLIGKEPGPMVELLSSFHKKYHKALHGLIENGQSFRNNKELHRAYGRFRKAYWKYRAETAKTKTDE